MRYLGVIISVLLLTGLSDIVSACPPSSPPSIADGSQAYPCVMKKTANIGINLNVRGASALEAKAKLEQKMDEIIKFAEERKAEKLELQSMNYSIYAQNDDTAYDVNNGKFYILSGSASFQTASEDAAFALVKILEEKKLSVSVDVNAYREGDCN